MKLFEEREIFEAYEFAAAGGQALHLFSYPGVYSKAPICFKKARLGFGAHLFDQDIERLITTAKCLGIKKILVSHKGSLKQHVDLCGRPLKRAMRFCRKMR